MTPIVCESGYDMLSDAPLVIFALLGYLVTHLLCKRSANARSQARVAAKAAACATPDAFALPSEVQGTIAALAGLEAWASATTCSRAHREELWESDRVWTHLQGEASSKDAYRRRKYGLVRLPLLSLETLDDVDTAHQMLKATQPADNVSAQFLRLFEEVATNSHALFWTGAGDQSEVCVAGLAEACVARADLFTRPQCQRIAELVGEHQELAELCKVEEPEGPSGADLFKQLEQELDQQIAAWA